MVIPAMLILAALSGMKSSLSFFPGTDASVLDAIRHKPLIGFEFIPVKDTIFTLSDSYIAISLNDQTATLYSRNDTPRVYKISTGNPAIHKGIETREGFFTVQNKTPAARSRQFNNAELFNWIGFNYNIGFHGLRSKSYYRYLGKKPSSHGCVRISREDGSKLYRLVKLGTPVIVYKEETARVLAFAVNNDIDTNVDIILKQRGRAQFNLLKSRLENLYSGKAHYNRFAKVFIDGATLLRPGGYDMGKASNISSRQEPMQFIRNYFHLPKDNLSVNAILKASVPANVGNKN